MTDPADLIEQILMDSMNSYRAGMGLPPLRSRCFYARCGSLIRDTGADDLAKHETSCPACVGGWSIWDLPESEERDLDDPQRGQAAAINKGE